MPRPDTDTLLRERGTVLRAVGLGLAVVLGVLGVVLIVKADATKYTQMGAILMLWGLLLGSFVVYGVRRPHETPDAPAAARPGVGSELELRSQATEVESARDVRVRREAEARLQEILRQEIREAVNREVGSLRSEIASLRTELLEKVGGQLRLEHIETTRVIGSDLEALQGEIRALKAARDPLPPGRVGRLDGAVVEREIVNRAVVDQPAERVVHAPEPAAADLTGPIRGAANGSRARQNGSSPARPVTPVPRVQPAPPPPTPAPPPREAPAVRAAEPARAASAQQRPATAQRPATPQQPAAPRTPGAPVAPSAPAAPPAQVQPQRPARTTPPQDPFANLPRLTPFVEDDAPLPPGQAGQRNPATRPPSTEPTYVRPPAAPPVPPAYEGRRRRNGAPEQDARPSNAAPEGVNGSAPHASGAAANGRRGVPAPERDNPGRRRRADEADNDNLLARLLERERH